ncbi:MAG: hydroxymethylbilane synthase, partial [Planctomycetaceae bacterium]|nr:hydroxymethylbilane synthase [Planctomycetaceae bacterium]
MTGKGNSPIRIATRASRLALWQAHHVAELLRGVAASRPVEIVHISTLGDRDKVEPLHQLGTFGVFTREVQNALLDGRADIAVHSLKDLPTENVEGLVLGAVPQRASSRDVLVLPQGATAETTATETLDHLKPGARVGTGSLRRRAQLLHRRGDLELLEVRGNVETRLEKLDAGVCDALVLAEAG